MMPLSQIAKEIAVKEGRQTLQFCVRYPNGKKAMEAAIAFPSEEIEKAFYAWFNSYAVAQGQRKTKEAITDGP